MLEKSRQDLEYTQNQQTKQREQVMSTQLAEALTSNFCYPIAM